MSENKKRHELVRRTKIRRATRRIRRGVGAIRKSPSKALALLAYLTAIFGLWALRHQIMGFPMDGPLALFGDILAAVLLVPLGLAVPIALCWAWGGPLQAGKIQDNLFRAGLVNPVGEEPELIEISHDPNNPRICVYEFYICGVPLSTWLNCADAIQSALNVTISDLRYGVDHHILLSAAPPANTLPTMLTWHDRRLPLDNNVMLLGESLVGLVTVDISTVPHILLGGATGSGKSGLLRLMLRQAICKGMGVYIADFKGGVDFSNWWRERCSLCYDMDGLLHMLDEFMAELERRKNLLREANVSNMDAYNNDSAQHLHRMIFACDEVAAMLDKTGRSKAQKEQIDKAVDMLSCIAQQGRSFGLHLFLSTQRPDATLIPGQIRSNTGCKICGRADSVLPSIIIDNTSAADLIPNDAQGRFVLNDGSCGATGTVFQAYWLKDTSE